MDLDEFEERYNSAKRIVDSFEDAALSGNVDEMTSLINTYNVVRLEKKFLAVYSNRYVVNAVRNTVSPQTIRFLLEAGFSYRWTINLITEPPIEVVKEVISYHYRKTKFDDPSVVLEVISSKRLEAIRFMFSLGINLSDRGDLALTVARRIFMLKWSIDTNTRIEISRICLYAGLLRNPKITTGIKQQYLKAAFSHASLNFIEFMLQNGFELRALYNEEYVMEVLSHFLDNTPETINRIRFLAQHGISFNQPTWYRTPLQYASSHRNGEIVRAILETGVSIDQTSETGSNILHEALWMRDWQKVRRYVFMGADMNLRGPDGFSFMSYVGRYPEAREIYIEFAQGKRAEPKTIRAKFE